MSLSQGEKRAIRDAKKLLKHAGVWDPDYDIGCLVDRYLWRADRGKAVEEFMIAVRERCERIPLGHIVGAVDFEGLSIAVGTGVFVPRRHSAVFHHWIAKEHILPREGVVLDMCAGSGAIGLAIAQRWPQCHVTCIELDEIALQYLKRNVNRLADKGVRVSVLSEDLRNPNALEDFLDMTDLVVANPPYVPEQAVLLPEWQNHHPRKSVYASHDGLDLIQSITSRAFFLLRNGGWVAVEHGESQAEDVRAVFLRNKLANIQTINHADFADASGAAVITVGCKRQS